MKKIVIALAVFVLLLSQSLEAQVPPYQANSTTAKTVNSANAIQFKKLIPQEIYPEVRAGNLIMSTEQALPYQWGFGEGWLTSQQVELDESGSIKLDNNVKNGSLFDLSDKQFKNAIAKNARKILWNTQATTWRFPLMQYKFVVRLQQEDKIYRELEGKITRLYNWRVSEDDKTGQLFRENIILDNPAGLKNYSWSTFRFLGGDEDIVWVYSPIIEKARELTGSNRSDLLAGSIAADDFFGWSGKVELVEGHEIKVQDVLVPFSSRNVGTLKVLDNNCYSISETAAQVDQQVRWNYGSRKYPQGASWLPTDAIFVPRKVFKVELLSNDPYSLSGRQTVYIDAQTNLPVYRFVYDRAGKFWKSIIMIYGLASNGKDQGIPYYSQMIILDSKANHTLLMDYFDAKLCSVLPQGFDMGMFDPRRMEKKKGKQEK